MLAKKKILGEYRIGRTIGEGAFSKVKLASHKLTGQKVAIKIIKKEDDEKQSKKKKADAAEETSKQNSVLSNLSKEVKLLMRLDHPNIIKLHQVIDTEEELFIIMEYASGGELIDYIAAKGSLSEKEGRKFFRQLLSAMDHCHLAGVVHRDLKLENMLLSTEKNLLLSDFGLGRTIYNNEQYLNTFCGTPLYAGPELVSGIKYIGPSADIWSLGIVLFIMISGKPPFRCETISELYQQIKTVKYSCPSNFSPELKNLLAKMLVKDPNKRATMDELRIDEWVNMGEDQPPLRVYPRIIAADREENVNLDEEIDQLVSQVEQQEGFTVYSFRNSDSDFNSSEANIVSPVEVVINPAESKSESRIPPKQRRSSITNAFKLFTPFSKSVTNEAAAHERAKSSEQPQVILKQVQKTNTIEPQQPGNSHLAPLNTANNRRRHSVGVATNIPSITTPEPLALPSPTPSSNSGNSFKSQGTGSLTDRRRSADQAAQNTEITASSMSSGSRKTMNSSIFNSRSLGPSMEQISEEGEVKITSPSRLSASRAGDNGRLQPPNSGHERRLSIANNNDAYNEDIRSVRFSMNLLTINKEPQEIMNLIELKFKTEFRDLINFRSERRGFTYICRYQTPTNSEVVMEIEIVKVWLLKMHGVRVKRLGGDALSYKNVYERILNVLKK